jgi:quercetin dioxygenase-like cupin family protein
MQTFKNIVLLFVMISFLFTTACNQSTKNEEEKNSDSSAIAVIKTDSIPSPVYDSTMDPSIVGAAFSKKLKDTLGINMYEVTLKPGDSMPFHSHPDHAIYLLDTGTTVIYEPGQNKGEVFPATPPGTGWIMGPFNDALKNMGKTSIRWLEVDIHRPRGIEMPPKPAYDAAIDRYTLGGASIQKIADTLGIKMFVSTLKPGDSTSLHSHPDYSVYILQGGELAVTFPGGIRKVLQLKKGMGFVSGPLSHIERNIGKTSIKALVTHIYRPRSK